jgi:3-oxoacyl-[acyl-carrier protein] reductase
MDFGIAGRRAIVCGSSQGLGRACAEALAREGAHVFLNGRTAQSLEQAAREIATGTGAKVEAVVADVTTPAGRGALLAACPNPDILVNNAGGPPPGNFRSWSRDDWIRAIDGNMLSAIELIRLTIDGMIERRFGRVVNITSHMVKSPVSMLGLSNGARAGLTGFVSGLSREVVAHNVTLNNLLPGQFDTGRLRSNHEKFAAASKRAPDEVREGMRKQIPAQRFGTPEEFGVACAFLCSAHAGFITGQSLLLDGGQFPGLL